MLQATGLQRVRQSSATEQQLLFKGLVADVPTSPSPARPCPGLITGVGRVPGRALLCLQAPFSGPGLPAAPPTPPPLLKRQKVLGLQTRKLRSALQSGDQG